MTILWTVSSEQSRDPAVYGRVDRPTAAGEIKPQKSIKYYLRTVIMLYVRGYIRVRVRVVGSHGRYRVVTLPPTAHDKRQWQTLPDGGLASGVNAPPRFLYRLGNGQTYREILMFIRASHRCKREMYTNNI